MSGGHFDYQEFRLNDIVSIIEKDIKKNYNNNDNDWNNYGLNWKPETIKASIKLIKELKKVERVLHAYDYAASGDTNEDDFMEVFRKEMGNEKRNKI